MTAFLWTMFVLHALAMLVCMCQLTTEDYPRTRKVPMGSDVVSLVLSIAIFAWCAFLLFR